MTLDEIEALNARERAALADRIALELLKPLSRVIVPEILFSDYQEINRMDIAEANTVPNPPPRPRKPRPAPIRTTSEPVAVQPKVKAFEVLTLPHNSGPFERVSIVDIDKARERAGEGIW